MHKVKNFTYNGFFGEELKGYANWDVKSFVKWTNDTGIVEVIGTDNKSHLVPTFALSNEYLETLPEAPKLSPFEGNGDLFGIPSKS